MTISIVNDLFPWCLVPEIQTGNHVTAVILVGVEYLVHRKSDTSTTSILNVKTYLSCRGMQHANILPRDDVDQLTSLNVSDLDEIRLKSEDVWVGKCKCIGVALPGDLPIRTSTPTITVNEEREIAVVQEEFPIHPFDMDRSHVFFSGNKVE